MQQKVCQCCGEFFIMNRQELLGFFLQEKKNNTILCGNCKKEDCYNCNRFEYIKEQLEKNAFFERQLGPKQEPWPRQPVLWQVFNDFKKTSVISNFLIKKYNFINNSIIEIEFF